MHLRLGYFRLCRPREVFLFHKIKKVSIYNSSYRSVSFRYHIQICKSESIIKLYICPYTAKNGEVYQNRSTGIYLPTQTPHSFASLEDSFSLLPLSMVVCLVPTEFVLESGLPGQELGLRSQEMASCVFLLSHYALSREN